MTEKPDVAHVGKKPMDDATTPPPFEVASGPDAPVRMHAPPSYRPPPIGLEEGEQMLEYRKPRPFAYSPLLYGTVLGAVLFLLFLASGNIAGAILGIAIWGGLYYVLRYRYYARVGYWFTSERILVDDGTRVQMVLYDELALSSLAFEEDSLLVSTVFGREIILRGVGDTESVVRFLMKRCRRSGKGAVA
jgi:hypothetical protein